MRELHSSVSVSLDGFLEAEGSYSVTHVHGYHQDSEYRRYADEMFRSYDTLVCGRVTFQSYRQYQTAAADPAVSHDVMSRQELVVFSNTLTDEEVGDATRFRGDLVANVQALKEQPGGDILCIGSPSVRTQLFNAGLIDRFKIWYVPVTLGRGKTVFADVDKPINYQLKRALTFHNGLVRLEYEVLK